MKIEQNLVISVSEDEAIIINKFNDILANINVEIQDVKDNHALPFIDNITYPPCLDRSFAIFDVLNKIFE